jgi:hypothetical protein
MSSASDKSDNTVTSTEDLHGSTEKLIRFAYQNFERSEKFKVEDYCNTLLLRLAAAERCVSTVRTVLEHSAELGEGEVQVLLLKESECALFHLASAFESVGQLFNLIFVLGMPESTNREVKPQIAGVSFRSAKRAIAKKGDLPRIRKALESEVLNRFVDRLFDLRDQVTHRKMLDFQAVVTSNGSWQPRVIVDGKGEGLYPFITKLLRDTYVHIATLLLASVESVSDRIK